MRIVPSSYMIAGRPTKDYTDSIMPFKQTSVHRKFKQVLDDYNAVSSDFERAARLVQAQSDHQFHNDYRANLKPGSSTRILPFIQRSRDPFFTGRDMILEEIQNALETVAAQGSRESRICALYGMSGIGKTATAVEYIYRSQERYKHIFWLEADHAACLEMSMEKAAKDLSIFDETMSMQENVDLVRQWFGKAGKTCFGKFCVGH